MDVFLRRMRADGHRASQEWRSSRRSLRAELQTAVRRRRDFGGGANRSHSSHVLPVLAARSGADPADGVIRLQRPKAEKGGRVLAFRGRHTDRDAEIAELTALRNAWSTGVRCIDIRLAELERTARERRKRLAR